MQFSFVKQCEKAFKDVELHQRKIQKDIKSAKAFEVKAISFAIAMVITFPIGFYLCCKIFG